MKTQKNMQVLNHLDKNTRCINITKHKAFLRLAEKPYKIIKWFTENWDKEVGALGIGELRDGELFVERLVFPNQLVNGAHVHFKPEDWAPIVTRLSDEEFSKIIFYWHKHPDNMPGASQGDEDDTFDVFMPEDTDRPFFGFMQTSMRGTTMEYEARIEMRTPIFASITDVKLVTDEDDGIEEECQKIIEEYVKIGNGSSYEQPGFGKEEKETKEDIPKDISTPSTKGKDLDTAIFEVRWNNNTEIILKFSDFFETWVDTLLQGTEVCDLYNDTITDYPTKELVEVLIKPKKKCGKKIFAFFKEIEDGIFTELTIQSIDSKMGVDKYPLVDKKQESEDLLRRFGGDRYRY